VHYRYTETKCSGPKEEREEFRIIRKRILVTDSPAAYLLPYKGNEDKVSKMGLAGMGQKRYLQGSLLEKPD
jgi:hypothetical protein